MLALYAAAAQSAIELVVQISARTEGGGQDQPFLATKRKADKALAASGLNHIILRPALVLGRNAHGGTALLRALAAIPHILPLIHAQSPVETVSVDDVAAIVSAAVAGEFQSGTDIDLAAGETLTLRELVILHRNWLGLPPALGLTDRGIVMVWVGVPGDTTLWWSHFRNGQWSEQQPFTDRHMNLDLRVSLA